MFNNQFFRFLKKTNWAQRGSVLLQVMGVGALVATTAVVMLNQQGTTTKVINRSAMTQDLASLVRRIEVILANKTDCTSVVNGTTGFATLDNGVTITPSSLLFSSSYIFLEETNTALASPSYYGFTNQLAITNFSITRSSLTTAVLTISFEFKSDKTVGLSEFSKTFTLIITGDASNVTSCYLDLDSSVSLKNYCQGTGAVYEASTGKCYLIGVSETSCSVGQYLKGLSYNPATMMMDPTCAAPTVSYDTTGCVGGSQVPSGFNASGNLICRDLTSGDLWPLVSTSQKTLASEVCLANTGQLMVDQGKIKIACPAPTSAAVVAATATPTPTNTSTATPTATNTAVGTNTPIPTNTPTSSGGGSTPTPTNTPVPTNTPTSSGGGCISLPGCISGSCSTPGKPYRYYYTTTCGGSGGLCVLSRSGIPDC